MSEEFLNKRVQEELDFIDGMIKQLRHIKSSIKKREKLSTKAFNTDTSNSSIKQIDRANTNLSWQCMEVDRSLKAFARNFNKSMLDVSIEKGEYRPTGFQTYKS